MVKKMDFDAAPIYEKCHNEDSKLVMGSQFIESKEKPLTYNVYNESLMANIVLEVIFLTLWIGLHWFH